MNRKSLSIIVFAALALLCTAGIGFSQTNQDSNLIEYEITDLDPGGWIITAKAVESGETLKFRLPPGVFKGQTFNLEDGILKPGQKFSVRGPKNTRLHNMILNGDQTQLPRGKRGIVPPARGLLHGNRLNWEIQDVDPSEWVVIAQNLKTNKKIKFKVHYEAFIGYHFLADVKGIKSGQGFSIVTPNNNPMIEVATLLEEIK